MKELKLPEIKLFGKKIALPENERLEAGERSSGRIGNEYSSGSDSDCCLNPMKVSRIEENEAEDEKDVNKQEADKISKTKSVKEGNNPMIEEESQNPKDLSDFDNRPDTPSLDEVSAGKQSPDSEIDQSDTKNLKKPDKILPCPRCKSMETKFCYYNNYNVNQPRHFCKSCQRYWTAGGMMRNVPVGAGRRKNKNSVSNCHHINISDAADGFHHPSIKPNGTVLSFSPELPLNEKNATNGNDFARNSSISNQGGKNGFQETVLQNINTFPAPIPYYPNMNCPFPSPVPIPVPGICPPGFPMPFYPAPLWSSGIPGSWSFPWLPPVYPSASVNHSRDSELLNPKNLEGNESNDPLQGSILVPKTLRINDPDEAAMSSIWTTLGIKSDSASHLGLFKAFQPKNEEKKHSDAATSPSLQANPAALSRSVNFQETA